MSSPVSDGLPANVEEQSAVSDQVWDGYQEPPYLSEAYSEPNVDEDAVRKLTEFGDDYGSVIGHSSGTPSDVASRVIRMKHNMQTINKKMASTTVMKKLGSALDSDSDAEDFYDILEDTFKALQFSRSSFIHNKHPSEADYAELLATCQTHLQCLRTINQHIQTDIHKKHFTEVDLESLHVLISEWAMLQEEVETSKVNSVEESIIELQGKLSSFIILEKFSPEHVKSYEDLRKKMDEMQVALASLMDIKDNELLGVNLRVHRIVTESPHLKSPLKEDIAKLYKLWEDMYEDNANHLSSLHGLYQKWRDYHSHFEDLCSKITDLNNGSGERLAVSTEVTEIYRRELKELRKEAESSFGREFIKSLERDLWQLEKKLSLEKDDSSYHTEEEEEPFSRSVCYPKKIAEEDETFRDAVDFHPNQEDDNRTREPSPPVKESQRPSKLWRIFRAALPFQIAFALLCCLACVMEPHCCDFLNSFNLSLMPQLRYVRGPPPV